MNRFSSTSVDHIVLVLGDRDIISFAECHQQDSQMHRCALCGHPAVLQESHIIPSFVFAWMKRTSVTGFIRLGASPNRRVQDGYKPKLLGRCCEQRFSKWEKAFSESVFHSTQGVDPDPNSPIPYGPELLKFAASLSWRSLVFVLREHGVPDAFPKFLVPKLLQAEQYWQEFLLDLRGTVGPFEQHLIVFGPIADTTFSVPENMNRYLLRSPEIDLVFSPNSAWIYTKLCHVVFVGIVSDPQISRWRGTKINARAGTIPDGPVSVDIELFNYMKGRARRLSQIAEDISPKQRQVIETAYRQSKSQGQESGVAKATIADIKLAYRGLVD